MNQILDIQLHVEDGYLIAIDTTVPVPGHDLSNFIPVEFLTYNDANEEILPVRTRPNTAFELRRDGKYYYYKLLVPQIFHFEGSEDLNALLGEVFFDGKLKQVVRVPEDGTVGAITAASEEVTPLHAYNAVTTNSGANFEANESYFFPKKEILNVCNIRKCLLNLQRKLLLEGCDKNNCSSSKELRQQRDFLFNAVYVLDFLKETNNFEEAHRILDNLSSCGFACEDKSITFSDCGCGNTI